jgi:xylulokinase
MASPDDGAAPQSDGMCVLSIDLDAQQSPTGSNGLIFRPWLYGAGSPVHDAAVRGGFLNLSLATTRPDMARAVLEGVALQLPLAADLYRAPGPPSAG